MAADFQHWDEVRSPLRADWETQCASFERPRHLAADSRTHRTCLYPREAHRNLRSIRQCPETGNIQNSFPHRRTNWFSKYLNWGMWIFPVFAIFNLFPWVWGREFSPDLSCSLFWVWHNILTLPSVYDQVVTLSQKFYNGCGKISPYHFQFWKGFLEQYRRKINPGQSICMPACSG